MERDVVMRIDKWDDATFRQVMTEHGQEIWNYSFAMTGSRDTADDITQDIFIKVYYRINTFRGESSFKTWLFAIARNTILNYRRTAFLRKIVLTDRPITRGMAPSAEKEALGQLSMDEIWSAVIGLPVKLREVLVLEAKHGLSVAEMAALLSVPEGTVKSRLSRARARVADSLKEVVSYGIE